MHSGIGSVDMTRRRQGDFEVLLVAVIRVGADITLAPAELRDLTLDNPNVAVRSLRVFELEGLARPYGG
jgi:hypothetical protein